MDNYNDGSRVIDSNFDGEFLTLHPQFSAHVMLAYCLNVWLL